MAHLDSVPSGVLETVATRISDVVSKNLSQNLTPMHRAVVADAPPQASPLRLGETLQVWKLKPAAFDALAKSTITGDVSDWVEKTPFLYHQIKLKDDPQGCARSSLKASNGTLALSQINASPAASRIDQLFKLIESNEQKEKEKESPENVADPVIRLLEIPPYHVFALWLFDEARAQSRVLIIDGPKRQSWLEQDEFLTSQKFFEGLANTEPIVGVERKADPREPAAASKVEKDKAGRYEKEATLGKQLNSQRKEAQMSDKDNVEGRMGDISGRMGDISGRLGDVSGRLGDVSGRLGDVSGRLGDVSGSATLNEVQEALIFDRLADQHRYNASRISRLESEMVLLMRWVEAQLRGGNTKAIKDLDDSLARERGNVLRLDGRLEAVEKQLKTLSSGSAATKPTT